MSEATNVLELRSTDTPLRSLLADLWRRRDLMPMLARQHFHGQFRAARLGVIWTVLQPLVRGAVLAVVFSVFIRIPVGDMPYPAFVLTGTAVWSFIALGLTAGTQSIVTTADLAGRVYFPRLMLPAMPAASAVPGFVVTLVIVVGISAGFGVWPSPRLLAAPLAVLLAVVLTVSLASVLSLLFVYFRDVGQLVTTVVGVAFYVTPVLYLPSTAGRYQILLELNPATGPIALTRWSLLGSPEPVIRPVAFSLGWTALFVMLALTSFRRHERICVDRL